MSAARRSPSGLFVLTICAGSFLLFLVEPLVARMALPRLGGAAAVWNSAMLVYQLLLLAGYAYAHRLSRLKPATQRLVHGGVLLVAAAWLPIGLAARDLPAGAQPALWAPWLFASSVGPLFFAVAAQAPLLQRWYAIACPGREPYPLYAASNLGSFAGLLAYPLIAEPLAGIAQQHWWWSAGYLLLVALTVACAARLPRGGTGQEASPVSPAPSWRAVARWVTLAFVASGLMLATSTYVTTDVVAMPLLWALPLGTYLLSFTVAFAGRRWLADRVTAVAPLVLLLMGGVMMGGYQPRALFGLAVALAVLFAAAVGLHTALYRCRPAPDRLTGFYLALAVGGALGGVFCGLLAPVLFDWTWEYPLLILAAGVTLPLAKPSGAWRWLWRAGARRRAVLLIVGGLMLAAVLAMRVRGVAGFGEAEQGNAYLIVALLGLAALADRAAFVLVLAGALAIFGGWRSALVSAEPGARARSYFGVYAIRDDPRERLRELASGTTTHGVELTGSPARERTPTTYYLPGSGVGQAMAALPELYGPGARVGVVGLGAGTLACYARPGQRWSFFEIDPAVVRIAQTRFRFLADCAPAARIVVGDARLALERQPASSLDLLALDAFASDAIPIHLMTREAFAGYARVLSARGVLLVHVSNRFVDLEPVVAAAARAGGWGATVLRYSPSADEENASLSEWIALSRAPDVLALLEARDAEWGPLAGRPGFAPWTDDRATVLPLVKRLD